ncbi:intermembrane lipid transfer protein Vps13 isoform X3 [Chironomus tepperi]|uniref:intermembrane lipid transfer protein Vps13 isoform X3 n=1 Tax=Chironomus tepperi TaxID=113505 RepID=UPI00391F0AD4
MVFESIVADILNRYLGDYVENLDRGQLKIGIWGGDVVLKNLVLKQSALKELDLPVQTTYGHLGSLVLKIPWKNLYSAPVEAYIDRLYLLAVPNNSVQYNGEREEKAAYEAKKAELERIQIAKKLESEKNKPKEDKTFAEKLSAQIINNVQIKISDIHIRYEDNISCGNPFAIGITLSNFSVHTTDFDWNKTLISQSMSEIFKVAQLESLAVYMNCDCKLFQEYSQDNYLVMFRESIATKAMKPSDYDFILGPINSEAKLKLNPDPESNEIPFSIPKIILNLTMETLRIGLTKFQYQDVMQLIEQFGRMSRAYPYRKFRPHGITYRGHYKEWWHFAFRCILETDIQRRKLNWSWENMKETRNLCRLYADLYRQKLTTKKPSQQLLDQIENCEKKLNLQNLVVIRQQIEFEVEKLTKEKEVVESKGWFSGWWGGKKDESKDADSDDIKKKFQAAMTQQEKEKLFKAIGYQENSVPIELPETFVAIRLHFILNCLEVSIKSDIDSSIENVMLLQLNQVKCSISQRPSAQSIKLNLSMKELQVYGLQQKQYLPVLVQSQIESKDSLLDVMFESNPLDKSCDQRIKVQSQPIQLVYNGETIIQLLKVFQTQKTATLAQLQDAAAEKLIDIKERSSTGLQYAISSHPRMEVDIIFAPSYILIPHGGKYTKNESVLVVSLGQLLLKTEPRPIEQKSVKRMHEQGISSDEILKELISQSYDKFTFEIHNIQFLMARRYEDWEEAINIGHGTEMHLLEPTFMKLSAHLSVITDDPRLPKCKISCELPSINISVTEDRVLDVLSIISTLPLPESNEEIVMNPISKEQNFIGSSLSLLKFLDEKQQKLQKRFDPPPENTDLIDGVVQFTEVEAYFVLHEVAITICKAKTQTEEYESSSDEFETPSEEFVDAVDKQLNVVSPSFKSIVNFDTPYSTIANREKMMCIKVKKLEMNAAQRTYELKVDLKLGAVSFDQYRLKNEKEIMLQVINTPRYDSSFEYLFALSYINCKKTSPEFNTKYHSVEQMIDIKMSTVVLILNQDGISELIKIANDLQNKIDEIMNSGVRQPKDRIADAGAGQTLFEVAKEKLPMILEEDADEKLKFETNVSRPRKKPKIVDSIKIKVLAKMEDVTIKIENDVREIAAMEIKNLTSGITMKTSYTEVTMNLEDIVVTDLNPKTIHTNILSIIGGDALKMQLVLYNLEDTSEYNSDNMRIDVNMGCAKIIFMNWFISSVLNFLDHFQTAQERIKEASKAAAEAAKQTAVEAYEKATRIKMNIKIKAPIILVPVHSQSLEAIVVDLGNLKITNVINNLSVKGDYGPAVIDEMKIDLSDVKLSKVLLRGNEDPIDGHFNAISSRFKTPDLTYDIDSNDCVLKPTSFTLVIKRNLTSSWYKDHPDMEISGRLYAIELNVIAQDYQVIMQILEKNMTEGQNEFKKPKKPKPISPPEVTKVSNNDDDEEAKQQWQRTSNKVLESKKPFGLDITPLQKSPSDDKKVIDVSMKFAFQIDSITLNLFTAPNEGLACFGLYYLSLNGQQLADGSLSTTLCICDINLDDKRPNREGKITRFMERRERSEDEPSTSSESKSMVDITFRMKENEMFGDVKVFSFNLILSMDFLLKLSSFLQPQESLTNEDDVMIEQRDYDSTSAVRRRKSSFSGVNAHQKEVEKKAEFAIYIQQYDIILVEKMDDINCLALILNNEIFAKVRLNGEKQNIQGEIKNCSLYLSDFNPIKRHRSKHYVLHPCTISLNGSTPEDKGLHMSLNVSKIKICFSPATIELVNKIIATMTQQEASQALNEVDTEDYSDLWLPKKFTDNEFWFTKVEEAEDALSLYSVSTLPPPKEEKCIIEVPSISIIIENGVNIHTIPMLYIETSMDAKILNWSSEMEIESTMRLTMSYYNNEVALWEPLIEPVEVDSTYGLPEYYPWELQFKMKVDKHLESSDNQEPTTIMSITSDQTLELLATKTCIDVLQTLGNSFSKAIDQEGFINDEVIHAPYVLRNNTGLEIQLELNGTEFVFHDSNFKPHKKSDFVVFENLHILETPNIEDISSCVIYSCGQVYLQPKQDSMSSFSLLDTTIKSMTYSEKTGQEKFITLYIPEVQKRIQLPIHRADKRYFPLYRDTSQEQLGLISEVTIEMGSTIVTVRGILQVVNHFTIPITIHHFSGENVMEIGTVKPDEYFNIPIQYIHDSHKEIYFSIAGYRTSTQGLSWKESPGNSEAFVKSLQCDPINTYEPLYINAIRERFDVFFEVTSKITMLSACYLIRLRPPLILRNALPVDLIVSVSGCSVSKERDRNYKELSIDEHMTSAHQNSSSVRGEDFLDYGEKLIKPGDLLHLPTVKTATKNSDSSMYIVARIIQYLERDWSLKTEIPADPAEFIVWTFNSYDSSGSTSLQLGIHFENSNNGLTMTVYCPFWMINKTGLNLSYRKSRKTEKNELAGKTTKANDENTNILYHPPEYDGPILFSFREKAFFGKKKASIRVDSGEWSDRFSLDVAGSSGVIECKVNGMVYQIGVQNVLTNNSLTKQIIFTPYYVLINRAPFDIEVQEDKRPADPRILVKSNDCAPLWPRSEADRMLRVKAVDTDEITAPFKYDDVQCSLLQLKNKYGGINADVHVTEGVIYITFTEYHLGDAPGLIMNFTDESITFWEKGNVNGRVLKPNNMIYYTWNDPAGERKIMWQSKGKGYVENDLRRDGVDEFIISRENSPEEPTTSTGITQQSPDSDIIYWVSFLDGTQRVLLFTKNEAIAESTQSSSRLDQVTRDVEVKLRGLGLSLVNNLKGCDLMYIGIASSSVIWEQEKNINSNRFKQLKIEMNQLVEDRYQEYLRDVIVGANEDKKYFINLNGMIEVDFQNMVLQKSTSQRRIRRLFYPGFWLDMKTSPFQLQLHAKINRIQIDNQLPDSIFPIILAPIPPPKSVAATTELKPFIEMSVVQRIIPHSSITQFKYMRVLMQEFHVKVDLDFINAIVEMLAFETSEAEAKKKFEEDVNVQKQPLFAHVTVHSQQEQKNFYDNLHLGPIKVHVSFSLGTGGESDSKALPGIISTLLQGVGVTLTDVNDVVFRLAFFERQFQFFTQRQLVSECTTHYAGQAVKQLYVLVLGLDVLGNPFGLVVGFTKGVEDLFYEPFQGLIQGPGEFAEGLVLGVRSLFGHTVGGAAGAVSKITGAMGKGLSALTFDKDYQKKRRDALNKKPATMQEGLARGGKGLVMGVFDGVTGVVTKPISGARSEGVQGFFKGLGKGAVGLVARPATGIVDFASGTFDSVKRATELSDEEKKLRPPRFLHSDGIIRPYSRSEAEGFKIFRDVDKGKFAVSDQLIYAEAVVEKEVLLVTNHRIIYVRKDLFGWQSDWIYKWDEISSLRRVDQGIEITLQAPKQKSTFSKMFSSGDRPKKLLLINNPQRCEKLLKIMINIQEKYKN